MKKSGLKKLPLSLKTASSKQQKISNFFITSKTAKLNDGGRKDEENIVAVKNQCPNNEAYDRLPGENICTQCFKKSPIPNFGVCSQCNIVENTYKSKEKAASTSVAQPSKVESPHKPIVCHSKTDGLSSPDMIPATPPMKSKQKNNVKPAKRKCSFENEIHLIKKYSSSQTVQQIVMSNKICNPENSSFKENIFERTQKTNIVSKKTINPFCKLSKNKDTVNPDYSTVNNNVKSLYRPTPSGSHLSDNHEIENLCEDNSSKPKCRGQIGDVPCDKLAVNTNSNHGDIVQANDHGPMLSKKVDSNRKEDILPSECNSIFENIIENIFDDASFLEDVFQIPLRLDSNTRCKVTSVDYLKACGEVVLALTSCETQHTDTVTCVLRGSWANSRICVGDIVSVTARPLEGQDGCWVVDNEGGLLVIHPDTLLSGTTVVGSLFCMRRSVLSDMYRGIDSDSPIMIIGSFLHQLLQEVLKRKVSTLDGIKNVLDEFTKTRYFIFNLYSSGMLLDKTIETLQEFVPKIQGFVQNICPLTALILGQVHGMKRTHGMVPLRT